MSVDRRQLILDNVTDLVSDLLYYHRKEDEVLPPGSIDEAIAKHEISVSEIALHFGRELRKGLSTK